MSRRATLSLRVSLAHPDAPVPSRYPHPEVSALETFVESIRVAYERAFGTSASKPTLGTDSHGCIMLVNDFEDASVFELRVRIDGDNP